METAMDVLQRAKQRSAQNPKAITFIQRSEDVYALVSSWEFVPKNIDRLADPDMQPPDDIDKRWEWLWTLVKFDETEWIRLALLPDNQYTRDLIRRIRMLRLVNPDGTLQNWVNRYLTLTAMSVFGPVSGGGKRKKKPKKEEQPPPPEEVPTGDGVDISLVGEGN